MALFPESNCSNYGPSDSTPQYPPLPLLLCGCCFGSRMPGLDSMHQPTFQLQLSKMNLETFICLHTPRQWKQQHLQRGEDIAESSMVPIRPHSSFWERHAQLSLFFMVLL